MRVLWAARPLDLGGSQLRMSELIRHVGQAGGFESTVLSHQDGPLRGVLEAAGAEVTIAARPPLDDAAGYDTSIRDLCSRLDGSFDLVCGATVTSFPVIEAAARIGLPSVLRIGEAAPLPSVVAWLFGELDPTVEKRARWALGRASVVVSNSHAAVSTYREQGYGARFLVLPTGIDIPVGWSPVDTAEREAARRRLGLPLEGRVVVCAGTVWPVKGQAVLIEALRRVRAAHPELVCVLIGLADPTYAAAVADLVQRHDLSSAARIVPFQKDLGPWWRAADAVVCASESEALPATVLEAMAHGLPVLASRVGDLERVVRPGRNGWLCDPSDVASLMAGLAAVAATPSGLLEVMGAAAVSDMARDYAQAEHLDRWTDLLRGAAGGRLPRWARRAVVDAPVQGA